MIIAEDFKDLYNKEELLIRFASTYKQVELMYPYHWWYDKKTNIFQTNSTDNFNLYAKIQVLNILLASLDIKNEGEYFKSLSEGIKLKESYLK
jgi:hypothetical protein